MGKPLDPKEVENIRRVYRETGGSLLGTANKTGHNRETVRRAVGGATSSEDGVSVEEGRKFNESDDGTATLVLNTDRIVRTLQDAIDVGEVDTAVWYVDTYEISDWTTTMRVRQGQDEGGKFRPDKPIRTQQYRLKLRLKRIVPRAMHEALGLVFERFRKVATKWPKMGKGKAAKGEPHLAVFCACDTHFGKLAWAVETGENYDLKIAEKVLRHAVEDLIAEVSHRKIDRILFPFGHDWMHFDSRALTTTRGTPQDADGRFSKVLATAINAAVNAVEMMATVAPVQVELVPGNHDRTMSECICHVLAARFHHTSRVTVNCDPQTRKYVRYGTNLIGLTHGDMVKPDKLPNLMAADRKQEWAETTCHEWLIGHGHRSMKWTTQDTETQNGVVVRMLRALTNTDLWHFDSGYVSPHQAGAELYLYGRDRGYAGHAVVPARS